MKIINKKNIFVFLLGLIISSGIVYAASTMAKDVTYDNTNSDINADNVQDAIEELYSKINLNGVAPEDIGTVNVSISGVSSNKFTITAYAQNPEKIALYKYYIDGNLVNSSTLNTYTVTGLNSANTYNIEVYAVPDTSIKVSELEQSTSSGPVISLSELFDEYIYIDANNGNDTSGNGTKVNPYKTLSKLATSGVITSNKTYGIVLGNGNYEIPKSLFTISSCNKSINIIGNKIRTKIVENANDGVFKGNGNTNGGSRNYEVNFYRLTWQGVNFNDCDFATYNKLNFYNVAFDFTQFTGNIHPWNAINMINCTSNTSSNPKLRTTEGTIKLTNTYGGFISGYGTSNSNWNYQTNRIVNTPSVDNNYQITEDQSVWKGVGTGKNFDNTTANIGVYGGTYSWEAGDDLH